MDRPGSRLASSAGEKVVLPIIGLLGGLFVGAAQAAIAKPDEIEAVRIVVKSGLIGSFLGMSAAMVGGPGLRSSLTTLRGLAWLIGVAAILLTLWVSLP
jgi:hypothetical protein